MHKKNRWYELLQKNYSLFDDKTRFYVDKFQWPVAFFIRLNTEEEFDVTDYEFFSFDGWSSEAHFNIAEFLKDKSFERLDLGFESKILFYNDAEGYCTDYIFDTIHWIIDSHGMDTNKVIYRNLAMNNQELYEQYCDRKDIKDRITCVPCFTYNNSNFDFYTKPTSYLEKLPDNEKKLFLNLNWNAWNHRLLAIGIFHYYDLIDEGYITSPCANKYKYDVDTDFYLLVNALDNSMVNHKLYKAVKEKIFDLKPKYPLMIDDRSKYPNTNEAFYSGEVKVPVFTARYNSLFEVVSETHANGPIVFHEKCFWPIMEKKPFFHISSMKSIYHFKKAGYKTFSEFIDESYDDEPDLIERIIKIAKELVRLKELRKNDPENFYSMYQKMKPITEENYVNFYDRRAL